MFHLPTRFIIIFFLICTARTHVGPSLTPLIICNKQCIVDKCVNLVSLAINLKKERTEWLFDLQWTPRRVVLLNEEKKPRDENKRPSHKWNWSFGTHVPKFLIKQLYNLEETLNYDWEKKKRPEPTRKGKFIEIIWR